MKNIYTPNSNSGLVQKISNLDTCSLMLKNGSSYSCRVLGLVRNSAHDTDFRVKLESSDGSWFGVMVVSEESNYYGQHHVSEVKLLS